jgi:hypothetical protein
MANKSKKSSDFPGRNNIDRFVSYEEKIKDDYQRQKDYLDRLDMWYGDYRNRDEAKKFDINYNLFNGRLDTKLYENPTCFNIEGERIEMSVSNINHYPIISQVANAMYGEQLSRPFKPYAVHMGTYAKTLRKKKWNELIKQLFNQRVLAPLEQSISQRMLEQLQVTDPQLLTPEQAQQIQQTVQQEIEAQTPKEILDFMRNDYQTPTEKQGNMFIKYLNDYLDLNTVQRDGFKHAIPTGRECYYIGDSHGEPIMELCNPKYITCGGSQHTEWYQDMDWVKYEQWLSFEAAVQKYSEELSADNYRLLEEYAEPIGGLNRSDAYKRDGATERVMYELSVDDGYYLQKYGDVNLKTKRGQSRMSQIYSEVSRKYGGTYGSSFSKFGVREARFAWKDKRKLKRVKRLVDGKTEKYWLDEHYEPTSQDIEVTDVWVDEVWEATKLGTGPEAIYLNIRPVPNQFKSIFNPYDVELPFVGRNYSTLMNNSEPVAPIDMAKAWQLEFDVTMAQLKHELATDVGKVFIMLMNMKPDNMKWQDWLSTMKNTKLLLAAPNKHGMSGIDPQILRGVDLGRTSEIASKIQLLDYFRNNIIESMFFNQARMGAVGQYSNAVNTQVNQSASYNQTEGFFETHRLIVEKALNSLMNRAKHVYRDRPEKIAQIMDDIGALDFELAQNFWYQELGVKFSTSSADLDKVKELKQRSLELIQNGMSFDGILELTLADTPSEIISIFKKESAKIEQARAESMQVEMQRMETEKQTKLEEAAIKQQGKLQETREVLASQERRAVIGIQQFGIQADADRDGRADSLEKTEMELEFKREVEAVKKGQKDRELDLEEMKVKGTLENNKKS